MIDPKHAPPGQNAESGSGGPGQGTYPKVGSEGSGNIGEVERLVIKTAVEQGHEDTKNIMEHVKHMSREGNLEELQLQDSIQKGSRALELESNTLKKMSDTSDAIITGKGGGVSSEAGKSRVGRGILAAVVLLGVALFVGIRFFGLPANIPGISGLLEQNPGPPDINPGPPETNPGPPEQPQYPPDPGLACQLHFVNPADAAGIPLQGALDVKWSAFPGAMSYDFEVIPPAGDGSPWIIQTEGTSRKIYMENFPKAGRYKFAVNALDQQGAVLCATELTFDKAASGDEPKPAHENDSSGTGKSQCLSVLACP